MDAIFIKARGTLIIKYFRMFEVHPKYNQRGDSVSFPFCKQDKHTISKYYGSCSRHRYLIAVLTSGLTVLVYYPWFSPTSINCAHCLIEAPSLLWPYRNLSNWNIYNLIAICLVVYILVIGYVQGLTTKKIQETGL